MRRRPLTFIGCPKPFVGHIGTIQRNAICSWQRIAGGRIMLFGDEPDTAETCRELSLEHCPDVDRNEYGTPLLDDVLARAQRRVRDGLLCFLNCDIVLMSDFAAAVERVAVSKSRFLMIGQRLDLNVNDAIAFASTDWESRLRAQAQNHGRLHDVCGIDYFVFSPGLFDPVPPLAIGRASIDNWLVFTARRRWAPVIDATRSVMAIHQNHDYAHHPDGRTGVYHGPEAAANLRLAGGPSNLFWIDDATHSLLPDRLKLDLSGTKLRRYWDRLPVTAPVSLQPLARALFKSGQVIGAALRAIGLRPPLPDRPTL